MNGLIIFAGTAEGSELCRRLNRRGVQATVCVATEYGGASLSGFQHMNVITRRMDVNDMEQVIRQAQLVIDATHPYAGEVTGNIVKACNNAGVEYLRLLRSSGDTGDVISVDSTQSAVQALSDTQGNVLVTTGAKELDAYCTIKDYCKRLFVRVLPCIDSIERCRSLGFEGEHIIAMQGPFSHQMNAAMLKQWDCRYIVTKSTGTAGGLQDKLSAAKEAGSRVVLIERPFEEEGLSIDEVWAAITQRLGLSASHDSHDTYDFFPLFVPSQGKKVLVVGAGQIATRRVNTLLKFRFDIKVIALHASADINQHAETGLISLETRAFQPADIEGCDIVIAATDSRDVNALVGEIGRKNGCFVSVADAREECGFYFPAIITGGGAVVGVTSDGKDHGLAARTAKRIREVLT